MSDKLPKRTGPSSAVAQVAQNMLEEQLGELAYFGDTSYKYLILFIKDTFGVRPVRVTFDKEAKLITAYVEITWYKYLFAMIKLRYGKKLANFHAFLGLREFRLVVRRDAAGKQNGKAAL